MADEFDTKISVIKKPKIDHLNRQIPPQAHTPMYNWHKYWSRKTWNVVGEFIKTYCPMEGVIFDPFAGSGVVAMEALRNGRKAILCDILPVSTEIARLTIKPVSTSRLHEAYLRVEKKVKNKILELYKTQCPKCGDRREANTSPNKFDEQLLKKIDKIIIKEWHPKQKLYHINGKPFKEKQQFESLDELFTKRNLQALAWLMEAIEEEPNKDLKDFLKIGFTSAVHLCTNMCPVRPTRPFSSAWTEHSYWFAPEFMEQNVWEKFESAIIGKQGLIAAKTETNKYYGHIKFASKFEEVIEGDAHVFVYNGSCFDIVDKMKKRYGEKGCVDYIFTDPPYDASVQYGELAYLWVCWLKKDKGYLEAIAGDEVVRNERQDKNFEQYHRMLSRSFEDMFSVLKPASWLTVTFHNPTFKIRNATIRAAVFAGFELQKIHHQELARPSAKSLLQPFGSAQGDFYLRFYKPDLGEMALKPNAINELKFEKIVVDTAIRIIAERGEPTPYTIIINAIDPVLAQRGYFSELHTGLDVKTVLEKHLDKEFVLVSAKLGSAEGKLWWFKNPAMVPHLQTVPLTERVEQTVLRKLQQRGRVTFTEIWEAVSNEFPNSLTSDSMSIIDALRNYARPVPPDYWMIKPNLNIKEIEKEHSTIIAILAEIGRAQGYKIWVGKIEQNHKITGHPKLSGELKQFLTYKNIKALKNIQNSDIIEDIDLLWIKNDKIVTAFEVESTTSMTSGLQRGSNIQGDVLKYLVIPEDRENQLAQKIKSPMFADEFKKGQWRILFFDKLKEEYSANKTRVDLEKLVGKKSLRSLAKNPKTTNQLELFLSSNVSGKENKNR